MKYDDLSEDNKLMVKSMVDYCINNRICMGQEEGIDFDTGEDLPFVNELREFSITL